MSDTNTHISQEDDIIQPRKVAIVGTSDTSRHLAPFDDTSWEMWVIGSACSPATNARIDRVFEVHNQRSLNNDPGLDEELAFLRTTTIPVWMQDIPDWVPAAVQYPTDAITKEFGHYFTNTISYMLALAIYEGVDEIGIWGVDMAHGTEYAAQRPSCEYFIGIARGRGIPVYIPPQSDLLRCGEMYGLENSNLSINLTTRYNTLAVQLAEIRRQKTEAMLNEAKVAGAMEILSYVRAAWASETTTVLPHIPLQEV